MNHQVTVIIPTFNEEKTIERIIRQVNPYADEVLVAGARKSTDRTIEIAKKMGAVTVVDDGKGKGSGMRFGARKAKGDIIVFIDADGSHIPKDIPKLVKPIKQGKADIVVASRMLGGSEELHTKISEIIRMNLGLMINLIINYRFGQCISDSQNGFRAIRKNTFLDLDTKATKFNIETEISMKCAKMGYRIMEIPSRELRRKHGKSGIKLWKTGWYYIGTIIKNIW
jgi:glycosyltransferase involved in cell wall biosynthesis